MAHCNYHEKLHVLDDYDWFQNTSYYYLQWKRYQKLNEKPFNLKVLQSLEYEHLGDKTDSAQLHNRQTIVDTGAAGQHHPDKTLDSKTEEWMKLLNEAKEILLSEKRSDYMMRSSSVNDMYLFMNLWDTYQKV